MKYPESDDKSSDHIELVFEFVHTSKQNNTSVEMSCSWTSVSLLDLQVAKSMKLDLHGGSPSRIKTIEKDDIRTNRTGLRVLVKFLTPAITSTLSIDIVPTGKISSEYRDDLNTLPTMILANKNALNLLATFREYVGSKISASNEYVQDIERDLHCKVFRKAVDCYDVFYRLVEFWQLILK